MHGCKDGTKKKNPASGNLKYLLIYMDKFKYTHTFDIECLYD